jgi:isopenicillin N synthase-like dioxygenase
METTMISVIDISPFRTGAPGADETAQSVKDACETIGFFVITGHGIAPDTITRLIHEARVYFDKPLEQKTKMKRSGTSFGGPTYVPPNSESLGALDGQVGQADLKESIDVGHRHLGDSWPAGWDSLQEAWAEAEATYTELAKTMRALFCAAMGMPQDSLEPSFERHASSIRCLNYPEITGALRAGQVRAGVHTDYSAFTMIRGDDAPGLQARGRDGTWFNVPAVPGSCVVNIGDVLMRWTNDRWISTPHRVICLQDGKESPRRQSIAFFHNPGADAVIECLAPFRPTEGEPPYPPVTYQAYAEKKFRTQIGDPTFELPIDNRDVRGN